MGPFKKIFPELELLTPLIGRWNTTGETISTDTIKIKGTDSYEWASGGAFIVHYVDVMMGEEHVEVTELIGYDPSAKNYPMWSFDNGGTITTMHLITSPGGIFHIRGNDMRSSLTVSKDQMSMEAFWERMADHHAWMPWMKMRFEKSSH